MRSGPPLYLDLSTTSDVDAMRSSCGTTRSCAPSRVSSDRLDYNLAAVGLGVGIVAVGFAAYVFVGHPFGKPATGTGHDNHARPSFRVVPSLHQSGSR